MTMPDGTDRPITFANVDRRPASRRTPSTGLTLGEST